MNWNRPFVPGFLKKFDQKLLLNKPEIWSTRTHLVAYYGLLFILVLGGICFLYPNDARSNSNVVYWIFFTSVISLLSIVVWLIYLLRFNVFKRFGNVTGLNRLKVFGLYFISIAIIIFFTYIPPIVESIRANNKYKDEEIVNDINRYNVLWNQLEFDSVDHEWKQDTVILKKSYDQSFSEQERLYFNTLVGLGNYHIIDSSDLNKGDTLVEIANPIFRKYTCPKYVHLNVHNADDYCNLKCYDNKDFFVKVIKPFKKMDIDKLKDEMNFLINKYNFFPNYHLYSYYSDSDTTYEFRINQRYKLRSVEDALKNICEKKYRFSGSDYKWQFRILLYVSLVWTLFIFTFRHSTTKTFFLSILSSIVLTILSSLLIAFSNTNEKGGFILIVTYIILFLIISSLTFIDKYRSVIKGISINIFVWFVYYFPILIAAIINENIKEKYYQESTANTKIQLDWIQLDRNMLIGEATGFLLLIILLPTLIHKLYKKWYSLPEE